MTISEASPAITREEVTSEDEAAELEDLRSRLNSVLAVGLFRDFDEYLEHCVQVDVVAHCVLGDMKYSVGPAEHKAYRAVRLGTIYTAAHIQGLAREISILREASPEGWRELPLYELVGLTDEAIRKAATAREQKQAKRASTSGKNLVREHYLSRFERDLRAEL